MKTFQITILAFFIGFLNNASAIGPTGEKDTASVVHSDSVDTEVVGRHLDSLLNLWYVSKNQYDTSGHSRGVDTLESETKAFWADSIVRDRMNKLNAATPIEYEYNDWIKPFLNLYGIRKREQVERMLGLSKHYFPIFEGELDRKGLPLEFKYLPVIESALNPHATSRMGASGMWQFMFATGKQYGLDVTSYVDERRDVEKSTRVAVEYLGDLYNIYEDWLLVIAAYNCGPGNVNKAIRRSGHKEQFWKVYPYLPRETRGYVPAFVAASYVFHYHEELNLYPKSTKLPLSTDTVTVKKNLDFKTLTQILEVSKDELSLMNPQYKKGKIPGNSEPSSLKLPFKQAMNFGSKLDTLYAYQDSIDRKDQQKEEEEQQQKNSSFQVVKYKVKSGDNLGYIAEWFDCYASDLRRWNHIRGSRIRKGEVLKVYVPSDKVKYYQKIDQLSFGQKQQLDDESRQTTTSAETNGNGGKSYYTVQSGDTLWDIANQFDGVNIGQLKRLNGIRNGRGLKPGQRIRTK